MKKDYRLFYVQEWIEHETSVGSIRAVSIKMAEDAEAIAARKVERGMEIARRVTEFLGAIKAYSDFVHDQAARVLISEVPEDDLYKEIMEGRILVNRTTDALRSFREFIIELRKS